MARELKYSSHETDFDALQRELSGRSSDSSEKREDDQRYEDPYADEYDEYRR
ncbi:hypothetical protein JOM49_001498 [Amycolatopsis magusensis]|uniref:DUF3073 domain-containing protein n=1 Tax=Amycolatopsis magusensis TaxID=882444 RepID=A0ABS4PKL8_9PSEU|nr:hypothetical protein [Amycolatopsis magusensis]